MAVTSHHEVGEGCAEQAMLEPMVRARMRGKSR